MEDIVIAPDILAQLSSLQAIENDGHGIVCVRGLVSFLQKPVSQQQLESAVLWDWDKIAIYPVIADFIKTNVYDCPAMYVRR